MANTNRKSGTNTGRSPDGKFNAGNPGKPKGARNKATLAAQALLDGQAEALTKRAVELALQGDTTALRLCLERLMPIRRDAPVVFTVPKMKTADDAVTVLGNVIQAVADGDLTPVEGRSVAGLVDSFRRTLETQDIERRLAELEIPQ